MPFDYVSYMRDYRKRPESRTAQLTYQKTWYASLTPLQKRDIHLRRCYHISLDKFNEMLKVQNYCCALCAKPFDKENPHVDHDHKCCSGRKKSCGKCIRGLIHGNCNRALGLLGDSPDLCIKAATYLTERGVK